MTEIFKRYTEKRSQGKKGFTLIELIIVVAILAVLGTVVGVVVGGELDKSKQTVVNTSAGAILDKLILMQVENSSVEGRKYFKVEGNELKSDVDFQKEIKNLTKLDSTGQIYFYVDSENKIMGVSYINDGKIGLAGKCATLTADSKISDVEAIKINCFKCINTNGEITGFSVYK